MCKENAGEFKEATKISVLNLLGFSLHIFDSLSSVVTSGLVKPLLKIVYESVSLAFYPDDCMKVYKIFRKCLFGFQILLNIDLNKKYFAHCARIRLF